MLSIPHMIVVFIVVLVVFGPQKLPELAKGLGKLMAEFRKASTDFKSAFENEMRDLERQAAEVERKKRELLAKANAALAAPPTPPWSFDGPRPGSVSRFLLCFDSARRKSHRGRCRRRHDTNRHPSRRSRL